MPICVISVSFKFVILLLPINISPSSILILPVIKLNIVVLPPPFGPIRAFIELGLSSIETLSVAFIPPKL